MNPSDGTPLEETDLVWYVAYGSNLLSSRFSCYVAGGQPPGAVRSYLGCRDTTPWRREEPVGIPGGLHFGGESPTWGGGVAFLDPGSPGEALGRGYLITVGQLRDVVAQEARVEVGRGPALTRDSGRWDQAVVPAAYETVLALGERDGHPMFTVTAQAPPAPAPPAPAYARTVLTGLIETYGGSAADHAAYLVGTPGVASAWTAQSLADLVDG